MPGPLLDNPQITKPIWDWFYENKDHKLFEVGIALGITKSFYLKDFKPTIELLIGTEPK